MISRRSFLGLSGAALAGSACRMEPATGASDLPPAIAALDPQPLAESGRPWMEWVGGKPTIIDGFAHPTMAAGVPGPPGFDIAIDDIASRFEPG